MSLKFTTKDKILLVILFGILFGILYYQFVWNPVKKIKESCDMTALTKEQEMYQARQSVIRRMKAVIEENQDKTTGLIADYDNQEEEISRLHVILEPATSFQIRFEEPVSDGTVIRRVMNLSYEAPTYQSAKAIMNDLKDDNYLTTIRDVVFSSQGKGFWDGGAVSVAMRVTYYEGITTDAELDGLTPAIDEAPVTME